MREGLGDREKTVVWKSLNASQTVYTVNLKIRRDETNKSVYETGELCIRMHIAAKHEQQTIQSEVFRIMKYNKQLATSAVTLRQGMVC